MKVSLNIVKQFTDVSLPVDELVAKINQQLGAVEEVVDLGGRYKDTTIAKVVKCGKHPNADKLSVCEIDAGTGKNIQVVCGAPNVREGILVVWLPPKSIVPSTFDDKQPFVLAPKELRGTVSHGMLASPKELGLGDDHDGILEINPDEWGPLDAKFNPGDSFAETYGLNGTIINIENKMFTHRPDLFGQIGVAREIAGIQHKEFNSPDWYSGSPAFAKASEDELTFKVFNEAKEKVPRFMAVALKDVEVKPSPLWLQCALAGLGSKPINNIVDITNYVMLMTAQPTHAYDYDKLRGHKLGARMAKKGEKVTLLNHKSYELNEKDIVIADGDGPVGLAGIMGGGDSEVSNETKNIVLEVANFDMYAVRRSSMKHGLFTDALTRFNKGQSPLQNDYIMSLLMMSIFDISPGEQASKVFDEKKPLQNQKTVNITPDFINERLGLSLSGSEVKKLLENVEFSVELGQGNDQNSQANAAQAVNRRVEEGPLRSEVLRVLAPFWRTDIELPEDVVEEVGRLYGFDRLPRELPRHSIKPVANNELLGLKRQIREMLARAGANEVLTYSFVHGKLLEKVGQDKSHAFELSNALSPDLQYYRLSLMPSLLDKVHMNLKSGYDELAIFELGKAHIAGEDDKSGLPREDELTSLVIAASDKLRKPDAAYFQAREYLQNLIGTNLIYKTVPKEMLAFDITKPYEPSRTAFVYYGDIFLGIVGEFRAEVRRNLKLPKYCAGFELDTRVLIELVGKTSYQPLSKFPSVWQDITLKVNSDLEFAKLLTELEKSLAKNKPDEMFASLEPLGIYQAETGEEHKNVSFRLTIASRQKTLRDVEVNKLLDDLASSAKTKLSAERI